MSLHSLRLLPDPTVCEEGTGVFPLAQGLSNAQAALTLDEMRLAARQILHAAARTQVGKLLGAGGAARDEAAAQLVALRREAHDLRREYAQIWLARNKPEGLWLTLDQFNAGAAVLDRWAADALPRYGWGQ